jgi:hypothetical protein
MIKLMGLLLTIALTLSAQITTVPAAGGGGIPSGAAGGSLAGTYPDPTLAYVVTNPQTGTSYAILTTDRDKLVTLTNANAIAASIAQAGSTGFPDGWSTTVLNSGAGTATITPATSTIEGAATLVLTTGQAARIWSDGTNYRAARIGKVAASAAADTAAALTAQYVDWSAGSGGASIANKPSLGTAATATLGTGTGQVPITGDYQAADAGLTALAGLTLTRGALIYGSGVTPAYTIMAAGTNGYLFMMGANEPAWTAVPTWNQSTTGTAAGLTAQYIDWSSGSGGNSIANKPSLGTAAAATLGTGAGQVPVTGDYQTPITGPMTQAVENSADNTLSKGVGTSGRAFEKTGITVDDSNNMVVPGSISSGDGAVAGESLLYELAANGSNYRSWLAPDALTATVQLKHADAAPAGSIMVFPAPTGTVSQYAWQGVATANTASTIVARDGSGNFTAGTITATLTGNADTVTNGMTQAVENSADNTLSVSVGTSGRAFEKTGVAVDPSTGAVTGATIDAEGTGNVITTVSKIWLQAVNCDGTTASLNWDTIATLKPAAACSAGTTNTGLIRGLAAFSNSEVSQMQTHFALPSDWTGAIDLAFKWQTSATSGSVVWQAATVCVADAEVNDAAWNTASTVTDAAKGTTLQTNDATITGLTATGCAAGELLHLKVVRDPEHASDDLAATADLIGVMVTMRRAQ